MPTVIRYSERPELWERIADLTDEVWPEYNKHGDVLLEHWGRLYTDFGDYQFVMYDEDTDEVLGEGHSVPCTWDGTVEGLPAGIDEVMEQAMDLFASGGEPNAASAMAIEIKPGARRKGLSTLMLQGMAGLYADTSFEALIAPVRPSLKHLYPITPIETYCSWTTPEGEPFDPWMRVHTRLGADVLKPVERSLYISGTVAEWEDWTKMRFPTSGSYVFPEGLAPLSIDREADRGTYWEPNVWIRHRLRGDT
jgi:hypothetical protein